MFQIKFSHLHQNSAIFSTKYVNSEATLFSKANFPKTMAEYKQNVKELEDKGVLKEQWERPAPKFIRDQFEFRRKRLAEANKRRKSEFLGMMENAYDIYCILFKK